MNASQGNDDVLVVGAGPVGRSGSQNGAIMAPDAPSTCTGTSPVRAARSSSAAQICTTDRGHRPG